LHPCVCTLAVEKFDYPFQARDVLVLPQAQILRTDTALCQYGGSFGKNQSGSADGPAT